MAIKQIGHHVYEPISGDNTSAFLAAIGTGKPIRISPNGNDILLSSQINITDRDIIIEGNGVRFIQNVNLPMINIKYNMGTNYAITGVSDVEFDTTFGIGGAGTSLVTRLQMSPGDAANIVAGRHYRVASENTAPGGSSSENPRMAETVRVHTVDAPSGFVYLYSTLYRSDLYTSTPVIAPLAGQDYRTDIRGVKFYVSDTGISTPWVQGPLWCQGAFDPVFDVEVERACALGMYLIGNYRSRVRATIKYIHYNPSDARAYGVWVTSGESYGRYEVNGSGARHLFTDNWQTGNTGDIFRHGPHIGGRITGTGINCRGAAFDLHSSSVYCDLYNITAINSADGPHDGLGTGFQLRGYKNRVLGATTVGNEVGGQVFANTGTTSDDLIVEGHVSYDKKYSLYVTGLSSQTPKLSTIVRNCSYHPKSNRVIRVAEAVIRCEDVFVRPEGQSGGAVFDLAGNADAYGNVKWVGDRAAGTWGLSISNGSNTIAVTAKAETADAAPGDAAYTITDLTPEVVVFSTTLTANRAISTSVTGRKRVMIRRTAAGAFNLSIAHTGGTLNLAQNQGVIIEIHGASVFLVSPTIALA